MQTTVSAITRDDIKALKKAKSLVFNYEKGKSYINCILDNDDRDKDVQVFCDTRIENYGNWRGTHLGEVRSGCYVLMHPHYDELWQTILQIIRPGDILTLNWRANNSNQYITDQGIYNDDLRLMIRRGEGKRTKILTLHISSVQCPNNTAKMIKHVTTPKSILED